MNKKRLYTPGPLNTTAGVKNAMQTDLGSRETEFTSLVLRLRQTLLTLANADSGTYTCVPMPGNGTMMLEAVMGTLIAPDDEVLVVQNGAYGLRLWAIANTLGLNVTRLDFDECSSLDIETLDRWLATHPRCRFLAMVHCETSSGMLNPLQPIASLCQHHHVELIVDAMSSFGGIPVDVNQLNIACLVFSANKCLQGIPGIGLCIAKRTLLERDDVPTRSYAMDLGKLWRGLEKNGEFLYTPPTHVLLALDAALQELTREGGIIARFHRYQRNAATLLKASEAAGLRPLLQAHQGSPIITAFRYPANTNFTFTRLYETLSADNMIIYPGKLTGVDSFRIGTIGALDEQDFIEVARKIGRYVNSLPST